MHHGGSSDSEGDLFMPQERLQAEAANLHACHDFVGIASDNSLLGRERNTRVTTYTHRVNGQREIEALQPSGLQYHSLVRGQLVTSATRKHYGIGTRRCNFGEEQGSTSNIGASMRSRPHHGMTILPSSGTASFPPLVPHAVPALGRSVRCNQGTNSTVGQGSDERNSLQIGNGITHLPRPRTGAFHIITPQAIRAPNFTDGGRYGEATYPRSVGQECSASETEWPEVIPCTQLPVEEDGFQGDKNSQQIPTRSVSATRRPPVHDVSNGQQPSYRAREPQPRRSCLKKRTGNWSTGELELAMEDIDMGTPIMTAAKRRGIPPSSLRDHYTGKTRGRQKGPPTVMSREDEGELVKYLTEMQNCGHPLTPAQLRLKVAFVLQDRMTPFVNGIPGRGWMRGFWARHPELSFRRAQGLEVARARGLCESSVSSLYKNLEELYNKYQYLASQIWNSDETGAQAGRTGGAMVIARTGARNVHSIIPDQREWLSAVACCNAAGGSIPSFYVLKGKCFRRNYIRYCEDGATMAMQPKAWMTNILFQCWLAHFIRCVRETQELSPTHRHLLIFDGHNSHVTLEICHIAASVGIDLVTLPSHTSHALQPLDVSIFKPFKSAFRLEREAWTMDHIGKAIRKEDLAAWVSKALRRGMSPVNVRSGFRATGIYPINPEAVKDKLGPSLLFQTSQESNTDSIEVGESSRSRMVVEDRDEPGSAEIKEIAPQAVCTGVQYYVQIPLADQSDDPEARIVEVEQHVRQDSAPPGEAPSIGIRHFLQLPDISLRQPRRNQPFIDYSESHVLTSLSYLEKLEIVMDKRNAIAHDKEKQKQEAAARKADQTRQRAENKIRAATMRRSRTAENRATKRRRETEAQEAALNTVAAEEGERLHQLLRSNLSPPPGVHLAPLCGAPAPWICKFNQQLAIAKRRARQTGTCSRTDMPNLLPVPSAQQFLQARRGAVRERTTKSREDDLHSRAMAWLAQQVRGMDRQGAEQLMITEGLQDVEEDDDESTASDNDANEEGDEVQDLHDEMDF